MQEDWINFKPGERVVDMTRVIFADAEGEIETIINRGKGTIVLMMECGDGKVALELPAGEMEEVADQLLHAVAAYRGFE